MIPMRRNLSAIWCESRPVSFIFSESNLQLFMNERVDKLNSLTGSALATCLQEAEESVLPLIRSVFYFLSALKQMRACCDILEKLDFEVRSNLKLQNLRSQFFAGSQFIRQRSGMQLNLTAWHVPTDSCDFRFTALASRLFALI